MRKFPFLEFSPKSREVGPRRGLRSSDSLFSRGNAAIVSGPFGVCWVLSQLALCSPLSNHCQLLAARQRGQCRLPQEHGAQCRCWQCGQWKFCASSSAKAIRGGRRVFLTQGVILTTATGTDPIFSHWRRFRHDKSAGPASAPLWFTYN